MAARVLRQMLSPGDVQEQSIFPWPDSKVRNCAPKLGNVTADIVSTDVGVFHASAALQVMHPACPLMTTALSAVAGTAYTIGKYDQENGGVLVNSTMQGGRPLCFGGSGSTILPARSLTIPIQSLLNIADKIAIPITAAYGLDGGGSVVTQSASVSLLVPTSVYSPTTVTPLGPVGLRALDTDIVRLTADLTNTAGPFALGDLVLDIETSTAAGVLVVTSVNLPPTATSSGLIDTPMTLPANTIALTGAQIRRAAGGPSYVNFRRLAITLNAVKTTTNVSTPFGLFRGSPCSNYDVLAAACTYIRCTANAGLISNTASALNVNGSFHTFFANTSPLASVAFDVAQFSSQTKQYLLSPYSKGCYAALAPPSNGMDYSVFGSLPTLSVPICAHLSVSADNLTVNSQVRLQTIFEVTDGGITFAPIECVPRPDLVNAVLSASDQFGVLLACHNPDHLKRMRNLFVKIGRGIQRYGPGLLDKASIGAAAFGHPELSAGLGSLSMALRPRRNNRRPPSGA